MDALSYKGRSLSTGDVVVFQQRDKQAAYYVDAGAGYREVPEFFNPQEKQLTPDASLTGERIQTPRGSFYVTAMSREQIEAAGYGFHHQSEDGKYLIMGNGTQAYAIPAQQELQHDRRHPDQCPVDGRTGSQSIGRGTDFPFRCGRGSQGRGTEAEADPHGVQDRPAPEKAVHPGAAQSRQGGTGQETTGTGKI